MNCQSDLLGSALASADDKVQAEVLNAFGTALRVLCKESVYGGLGMQCYLIAQLLTEDGAKVLREILESYDYGRQNTTPEVLETKYARLRELDARIQAKERALEESPF